MKILLDSHALVWAISDPIRLSARARRLLEDLETELFVSSASVWELHTKARIGKLPELVVASLEDHLESLGALELPIRHAHARLGASFRHPHKDPFDRMLVAQSLTEGVPILTCDRLIGDLGADTLW